MARLFERLRKSLAPSKQAIEERQIAFDRWIWGTYGLKPPYEQEFYKLQQTMREEIA